MKTSSSSSSFPNDKTASISHNDVIIEIIVKEGGAFDSKRQKAPLLIVGSGDDGRCSGVKNGDEKE